MKKIFGISIIAAVILFLFVMTAIDLGLWVALRHWAIAFALTTLLVIGFSLLEDSWL